MIRPHLCQNRGEREWHPLVHSIRYTKALTLVVEKGLKLILHRFFFFFELIFIFGGREGRERHNRWIYLPIRKKKGVFLAAPTAHTSSQAREWTIATALTLAIGQHQILNPLSHQGTPRGKKRFRSDGGKKTTVKRNLGTTSPIR